MFTKILFTVTSVFLFCITNAQDKKVYKVVKTFHINSSGGWDYIAVNKGKIYVSHGSQVNILDEKNGDSVGYIPNTTGVHGIAFDNELNRGYTSNGRLNNVTVFDLTTNAIITQIATGENPDAIMFDLVTKKIITCNGRSKNLSVIDPATNTVVATIDIGGKPETAVTDDAGKLYVNVEDKNEIARVDLKTFTVLNHWSLAPAQGPTGLEIDRKTKRLFAGCEKLLAVIDVTNGKVITTVPIGEGCDGVAFDNKYKTIFTSNGEGTITAIQENNANDFTVKQTIPTKRSARTIGIDEEAHSLFLPVADYEAPEANAAPNARRKIVPGSFQVLVVQ